MTSKAIRPLMDVKLIKVSLSIMKILIVYENVNGTYVIPMPCVNLTLDKLVKKADKDLDE